MATEIKEHPKNSEQTTDEIHFQHPTKPGLAWCGTEMDCIDDTIMNEVDCVVCMDLLHTQGSMWWWQQRMKWVRSGKH